MSKPADVDRIENRVILNVGSEKVPEVDGPELRAALSTLKNRKAPREDRVASEMLKEGGETLEKAVLILLNK